MLSFPNAKINLGLRILSKRPDGYHNIESCLYPIPWRDVLEIVPAHEFSFKQTGLEIPGNSDDNLCVKAYQFLNEDYQIPPVAIHLHKVIPMGAGLGGGSADGAFAIKVLNALFDLKLPLQELKKYAARLGSDCPFFIENIPAIATDTGTTLHPTDLTLEGSWLAITHPGIHVSTKEAYAGVTPMPIAAPIDRLLHQPIEQWKSTLINDFEASIFLNHPAIAQIKNSLYEKGALYAAMSGSGSAVFGIFADEVTLDGFEVFQLR